MFMALFRMERLRIPLRARISLPDENDYNFYILLQLEKRDATPENIYKLWGTIIDLSKEDFKDSSDLHQNNS